MLNGLKKGKFYLTVRNPNQVLKKEVPKFQLGKWNDFVYNIKYTENQNGYIKGWLNGESIIEFSGRTAIPGGLPVFHNKVGLYRNNWPESMVMYLDNYSKGNSYKEVDPARFD